MAYNLSAFAGAGAQFFDSNGTPLAGGLLYVYTAGTTTPTTTWTTSSGAVANTNPIVMNAAGRTPFEIWLNSGVTYKFALYTATGVLIGTYDNIPAIDDPTVFNNLITVTGTNTLTGVSVPPYTSYVAGMTLSFIPANTNTDAVTLDLDGLGAKNVFVGSSTALSSGDLVAGRIAQIQYDGTRFQLYQSSIADNTITTAKIVNSAVTTAKIADANVTAVKLAAGAAVSNIGFTPVQQGGGTGQLTNKVYIGYSAENKLKATVDSTDFGYFLTGSSVPANSLSASGYEKLPSGLIMQWGTFTQAGSATTVTFPISFPSICVSVQQTMTNASTSASGANIASSSQFVSIRDPAVSNQTCYYFAIGY
jgi:hypothetical protein